MKKHQLNRYFLLFVALCLCTYIAIADDYVSEHGKCYVYMPRKMPASFRQKDGSVVVSWAVNRVDKGEAGNALRDDVIEKRGAPVDDKETLKIQDKALKGHIGDARVATWSVNGQSGGKIAYNKENESFFNEKKKLINFGGTMQLGSGPNVIYSAAIDRTSMKDPLKLTFSTDTDDEVYTSAYAFCKIVTLIKKDNEKVDYIPNQQSYDRMFNN